MCAQTFSRGSRRLSQTYLYKFVEVILRVPIQCNIAGTSLKYRKVSQKEARGLIFLKTFFDGIICSKEG